ncbi:MAG: UDP-N-acetylmuramate dehydrogenase, partial [Chloroflexota bacterium]
MTTLEGLLGDKLLRDEPLAKYTALRLGGPAELLYVARESNELLAGVVQTAWQNSIPVRVIGGGANVLIADEGVRGLVVVNQVKHMAFHGNTVHTTAGTGLTMLANRCASHGLGGFEWGVSVPGTLGGAVVNNAGAHNGDMSDSVKTITLLDAEHGRQTWNVADLQYNYRHSVLKARTDKRFLVLDAVLEMQQAEPEEIRAKMDEFRDHRKRTQPPGASLGSIFKNPPDDYAGRLIEAAELKGHTIGDAA